MGWYGNWDIQYNGQDKEKFVNLAKLLIPNYSERFAAIDDNARLECQRSLSWYSADRDISTIMKYLNDSDTITVQIDGETHPIKSKNKFDEYEYYDYEEQVFRKENGSVVIDNERPDEDRYKDDVPGIFNMLAYEVAYPDSAASGKTDTVDGYIKYIANEMAGNDEMLPIIQEVIFELYNPATLRDFCVEEYNVYNVKPDETVLNRVAELRENFISIESTKVFLESTKAKIQSEQLEEQATDNKDIPAFIQNMDKKDVRNLGGVEQLLKLVEVHGETDAKNLLRMLGYKINDKPSHLTSSLDRLIESAKVISEQNKGLAEDLGKFKDGFEIG